MRFLWQRRLWGGSALEEATQMSAFQTIADEAEHRTIREYLRRTRRGAVIMRHVRCGSCGANQPVKVQQGMRLVSFNCRQCWRPTTAWAEQG
jgi:hypothetical protein